MTEEAQQKIKKEIAERLGLSVTLAEAINIIAKIAEAESEKIFENMSEEEKEKIHNELFEP
jgi:hypothetical protein